MRTISVIEEKHWENQPNGFDSDFLNFIKSLNMEVVYGRTFAELREVLVMPVGVGSNIIPYQSRASSTTTNLR